MLMAAILGRPGQHAAVFDVLTDLPPDIRATLRVFLHGHKAISYRKIESTVSQLATVLAEPAVLVEHDHPVADPDTGEVVLCPPACPYMAADATWYVTGLPWPPFPPTSLGPRTWPWTGPTRPPGRKSGSSSPVRPRAAPATIWIITVKPCASRPTGSRRGPPRLR